jgi:hypothetical protein
LAALDEFSGTRSKRTRRRRLSMSVGSTPPAGAPRQADHAEHARAAATTKKAAASSAQKGQKSQEAQEPNAKPLPTNVKPGSSSENSSPVLWNGKPGEHIDYDGTRTMIRSRLAVLEALPKMTAEQQEEYQGHVAYLNKLNEQEIAETSASSKAGPRAAETVTERPERLRAVPHVRAPEGIHARRPEVSVTPTQVVHVQAPTNSSIRLRRD